MTQVDLNELSVPLPMEPKRLTPPSGGMTLILLLSLVAIIGWEPREKEAWQQGYDANRSAAYLEGWRAGTVRGKKEGQEQGKAAAEHEVQTGRAWQLYSSPAFLGMLFGAIVGLATQYTILWCCQDAGRIPELLTVAFVPAMKSSASYSILESRRRLLIWWEEEMTRLTAANELQVALIQVVHDFIARKLRMMTALEELTQARLLDLAQQELSRSPFPSFSET